MISLSYDNFCEHCREEITNEDDDLTLQDNKIYHTECLPENLKE